MVFRKIAISLTLTVCAYTVFSQQNPAIIVPVDSTRSKDSVTTFEAEQMQAKAKPGHMYKLCPKVDIPITAIGVGWAIYGFPKIYSKDKSTPEQIMNLKESDIPGFDRWAAGMSDPSAEAASDLLFYGSIPVPLALLLDKSVRKEAGKVGFMWLEAMSITGLFYIGTVFFVDRYRPETYNTDLPVDERQSGNNKDSFIGGHPALVATGMFFTAKVYGDYHPNTTLKPILYGAAIAATGATAYLRHKAGKHFPSDLLAGMAVGTLSGILVPHFHKNKPIKERNLGVMPYFDGSTQGITLRYMPK